MFSGKSVNGFAYLNIHFKLHMEHNINYYAQFAKKKECALFVVGKPSSGYKLDRIYKYRIEQQQQQQEHQPNIHRNRNETESEIDAEIAMATEIRDLS